MKLRLCLFLVFMAGSLSAQDPDWVRTWEAAQRERPAKLSAKSRIASANEPGEPMIVRGHIFQPDGKTPVSGATVFAYHTDAKGLYYAPGKTVWRLKGWTITDEDGAFEFATIRPAPYPSRTVPAHIHITVEGGGIPRQWMEEVRFADDSLVTKSQLESSRAAGFFGDVRPVRLEGKTQHIDLAIRAKPKKDF